MEGATNVARGARCHSWRLRGASASSWGDSVAPSPDFASLTHHRANSAYTALLPRKMMLHRPLPSKSSAVTTLDTGPGKRIVTSGFVRNPEAASQLMYAIEAWGSKLSSAPGEAAPEDDETP